MLSVALTDTNDRFAEEPNEDNAASKGTVGLTDDGSCCSVCFDGDGVKSGQQVCPSACACCSIGRVQQQAYIILYAFKTAHAYYHACMHSLAYSAFWPFVPGASSVPNVVVAPYIT